MCNKNDWVFQELISERDAGFAKLNQAIEAGEKLYPNTATEGREKVRQELRQMKMAWESLFDDLSSAQRKLEVALVQWTTFDDSYGQVEQWLRDAEMQLEGQIPLRSTLEEKKTQLQNFKVELKVNIFKIGTPKVTIMVLKMEQFGFIRK